MGSEARYLLKGSKPGPAFPAQMEGRRSWIPADGKSSFFGLSKKVRERRIWSQFRIQSNFGIETGLSDSVKVVLYRPGRRFLPEVLRRHIWSGVCKLALDVSKAIPVSTYNLTPSLTPFRYTMTSIHQSIAIWRRQPGNFSSAQNHHLELATGKLHWF